MEAEANSRIWKVNDGWQYSDEALENESPSRRCGISLEDENRVLQTLCLFIQDLGQKVEVTQLVINTAIVYLRRIFCVVDLKRFNCVQPWLQVLAACCLFVAAKVEEKPRKLEHVISNKLRLSGSHIPGRKCVGEPSEVAECMEDFKCMEMLVIKLLGFDLVVDHPHTHVVRACQTFNASADFAQTAYFMATNILLMTSLCVQYDPATIAAICIYLSFKWSKYEMFPSKEGQEWYDYMRAGLTLEKLDGITKKLMETVSRSPEMNHRLFQPYKSNKDKEKLQDQDKSKRAQYHGFIAMNRNQPGHPSNRNKPVLPGPSGMSSTSRPQPSPGPSGLAGSSSRPHNGDHQIHHRPGMPPPAAISRPPSGHHQHVYKADRQRSPGLKTGSTVVTTSLTATSSGSVVTATSHASTHPTFAHHGTMSSSIKGQAPGPTHGDTSAKQASASHGATPSTSRKLSLQDYHQRIEQRPLPPPLSVKPEAPEPMHRMHPVKPSHPTPAATKTSQSRSHSSPQQKKMNVPPVVHTKVSTPSERLQAPVRMDIMSNPISHTRQAASHSQLQAQPAQAKDPKANTSPLKTVKKEGVVSAVPDDVHLKTAKVMVQDLKDSRGQDKMLYNEASRKRSLSQSQEENTESSSLHRRLEESASKRPRTSRQDSLKIPHHFCRQSPPKPEAIGSGAEPIKLLFKRDAGKLQVKNNEDKSLKMKIRVKPDASVGHSATTSGPSEGEERIMLRLPLPSGSGRSHDKHSQHTMSGASADGHERKNKPYQHSSSGQVQTGYHVSSHEKERLYRSSSSSQVTTPAVSGDNNSSHLRKPHSRSSVLAPPSEFSFPEQFITPNLPENIFDESPDVNGSYGAPEAAHAGLSGHMRQMYSQSSGQQMRHFSQSMMNSASMYQQQPPLPPPLPQNPPPPPPPPPP